jgi:choline dehydrogenase-like flavoprotein
MGIAVERDHPHVGQHLQDHFQARLMFRASQRVTLNERVNSLFGMAMMGAQYAMTRAGPCPSRPAPRACSRASCRNPRRRTCSTTSSRGARTR